MAIMGKPVFSWMQVSGIGLKLDAIYYFKMYLIGISQGKYMGYALG